MPALSIRSARLPDGPGIAAMYAHHNLHGTAAFDTVPRFLADTETMITKAQERGWPFLIAERDGIVIGYAYASQFRDRLAYAAACENSIYIDPGHVGQGIGKLLLAALLSASQQAGFRQIIAVIGGGEPSSVALHASLGFQ